MRCRWTESPRIPESIYRKGAPAGRQRGAYALIITAAVALHIFAVCAVLLFIRRELTLREYRRAPSATGAREGGVKNTAAFSPARVLLVTIDDGPSADSTPLILDVLSRHGARAVFFPLKTENPEYFFGRILDEGHEIGNHTYSHDFRTVFDAADLESFRLDVNKMNEYLGSYGITPTYFRFPGGADNRPESVIEPRREFIRSLGLTELRWDISLGDASVNGGEVEAMAKSVLAALPNYGKAILLMHDSAGHGESAAALDIVLTELEKQGWIFG